MKKIIFSVLFALVGLIAMAKMPARVSAVAKQIGASPAIQVNFLCNGRQSSMLLGDNGKFALDLVDVKIYYDGKTQWAYSAADKEVTIINPTSDELVTGNPAAILASLGSDFNGTKVKDETYKLTPVKPDGDIREVSVSFPATGVWPHSMTIVAAAGTLSVSDMKFTPSKTARPVSAFQFKVPKGTTVTDLR